MVYFSLGQYCSIILSLIHNRFYFDINGLAEMATRLD